MCASKPIAAYGFKERCWFYWDTDELGFFWKELSPGTLVKVQLSPIPPTLYQRRCCN